MVRKVRLTNNLQRVVRVGQAAAPTSPPPPPAPPTTPAKSGPLATLWQMVLNVPANLRKLAQVDLEDLGDGNALVWDAVAGEWVGRQLGEVRYAYITAQFALDGTSASEGTAADLWVPYGFKVLRSTLLANAAGTLTIDVRASLLSAYPPVSGGSICAGSPPTLSGAAKAQDAVLTGWSTVAAPGAALRFVVTECAGPVRAALILEVDKWQG